MGIVSISRDWGIDPQIVRIATTDSVEVVTAAGYIASQAANIAAIQNGVFQWRADDTVLIAYADGSAFFRYDILNDILLPLGLISSQINVSSAQILGMYADPVLVIPAPGPNNVIIINSISGTYLFDSAQYQNGGAIGLEFGDVAHLAGEAASNTLAAATFNAYAASNTFILTPDNAGALADRIGLGVYLSNATGAFTDGDGSLLLNINYQVTNAA